MIYIGEFEHPKVGLRKVEMSNKEEFQKRIKEISAAAKIAGIKNPKSCWKISEVGSNSGTWKTDKLVIDKTKPA